MESATTHPREDPSEVCNICGEERRALIHTDTELHPDDAIDGLFLHTFEPIQPRKAAS